MLRTAAARATTFRLCYSDGFTLDEGDWWEFGACGITLASFAGRAQAFAAVAQWRRAAARLYGPGELLLVDADGRRVAGPWAVPGLAGRAAS